jgi:hypothetical protein
MQDRRKQPRKDLMSYSQVYDLHDGKLIGYLGDLNLYGAMVISDHEMTENEKLHICTDRVVSSGYQSGLFQCRPGIHQPHRQA